MPNPRDLRKYPILLFEAFEAAAAAPTVTIQCPTPARARSLRGLAYTLRGLLASSPEDWHQQLAANVQPKKFYIDGSAFVIGPPMLLPQRGLTITTGAPQ